MDRFVFIPMITPNSGSGNGEKRNYSKAKAGTHNLKLVKYLQSFEKLADRNISAIKPYFESEGIEILIYNEDAIFKNAKRDAYFSQIDDKLLKNTLIFIDPDIGLEIQTSDRRHILYKDMSSILDRMSRSSALMIYQHFPRKNRAVFLKEISDTIKKNVGLTPLWIHDNDIVLLFITKSETRRRQLARLLGDYFFEYEQLEAGDSEDLFRVKRSRVYQSYKTGMLNRFLAYRSAKYGDHDEFFDTSSGIGQVFLEKHENKNLFNPDLSLLLPPNKHHKWFRSMSSSQALAASVLGTMIRNRDIALIGRLLCDDGNPLLSRSVDFWLAEFEYDAWWLEEGKRKSQIDLFLAADGVRIAIECKLTEKEIGVCSRRRPRPSRWCKFSPYQPSPVYQLA